MSDFLRQLGYRPECYWVVAGGALFLWLASAALPGPPAGRPLLRLNTPLFFGAALLAVMFAFRWPAMFFYRPVNPDEPQFLAGAITMLARGRIWWVDPMSSGPLVVLPLTLPGIIGWPVDYGAGRVVAVLLQWGQVFLAYLVLRHVHGDRKARLLVLPLACLMVFLIFWDFVPYSSESAPLFLCSLAVWLCLTAFRADGGLDRRGRLAGGGFVLGLLPFSKFQVLPLVAAIGLSTVVWVLGQPRASRKKIGADLAWLLGGTGLGLALLLLGLWTSGLGADIYESYLVHNLIYVRARALPWIESGYALHYLTGFSWGFSSFHYGLLALLAVSLGGVRRMGWRPLLLGWSLLLAAYFAVLAPGRLYPHYLLFLSLPLALLVGLQFGYLVTAVGQARRTCLVLWIVFLAVGVGPQVVDRGYDRHNLARLVPTVTSRTNLVGFINRVKRPGDTLAVWGWRPEFYVETQLPQASREAQTERQSRPTPQRAYFRARFLADLRLNPPAFFIDTIGPDDFGLRDRVGAGHESFPELKAFVNREYSLVSRAEPFRLYVRRSLIDQPD